MAEARWKSKRCWRKSVVFQSTMATFSSLMLVLLMFAVELGNAASTKHFNSFAGPYTAYAVAFSMCDSLSHLKNTLHIRVSHFNPARPREKQILTGNITSVDVLDDTNWAVANMATRSNNQWKENAFSFPFMSGACTAFRTHIPYLYQQLFKLDPNSTEPCFIPPAAYILDNEPVLWEFPYFKVMPYGHYLFKVIVGLKNERMPVFCASCECKIVPKV